MLKIKDNVDLEKIYKKYDLDNEYIEGDYEYGADGDIEYSKGGVFISKHKRVIYGIDVSELDLLYDLIKADLVEKVEE